MKKKTIKNILITGMITSLLVTGSCSSVRAAEADESTAEVIDTTDTVVDSVSQEEQVWEETGSDTDIYTDSVETDISVSETVPENSETSVQDPGDVPESSETIPDTEDDTGTLYSGEDGRLTWSIDEDGVLVVDGDGNCEGIPDWLQYSDYILSADMDIIGVTDMGEWFYNCSNMTTVDFSDTNTSQVVNMSSMFYGCSSLQSLNLSTFDTSCVDDMGMMFYGCSSLVSLDLSGFNTSNVSTWNSEIATGMTGMFTYCSSLVSLNLSNFNTANITDMAWMFYGCSSLTSLDLSSFNTSQVTSFDSMFKDCSSLTSLDLGNFDSSRVVNMSCMFENCNSLAALNLSSFSFDSIANVSGMFANCYSVSTSFTITSNMQTQDYYDYSDMFFDAAISKGAGITIYYGGDCPESLVIAMEATSSAESLIEIKKMKDTSAFPVDGVDGSIQWSIDTDGNLTLNGNGNVDGTPDWLAYASGIASADVNVTGCTSMSGWFKDCGITSFDFSDSDTSTVTDMSEMFSGCGNITGLDLSSLNTSAVTNMREMFASCTRMTIVNLGNMNTANVTNMAGMFYDCKNLQSLDLSSFNTANVTDMCGMFSQCYNVESINVSSFNTANVTDMGAMFSNCYKLQSLDLSNFDTSSVVTWSSEVASGMASMFAQCASLTSLDLSSFDTSGVSDMTWMFYDCNLLENVNLSSFDTSNVTSMGWMFYGCSSLTSLDLSNFDTSNVNGMYYMFADCTKLTDLNLDSFTFESAQNFDAMFSNCENIHTALTLNTDFSDKDYYNYADIFNNAATGENAEVILYYGGTCTEEIAVKFADTGSEESNIIVMQADTEEEITVYGHDLELNGNIGIGFFLGLNSIAESTEGSYVVMENTETGDQKTVYVKDAQRQGSFYRFDFSITAKQMADTITLTYYNGESGEVVCEDSYSAMQYAQEQMDAEDNVSDLIKALLDYGTCAQNYFGYRTDTPANSAIDSSGSRTIPSVDPDVLSGYARVKAGTLPEGIHTYGQSLILNDDITIKYYYQLDDGEDINDYTATLAGSSDALQWHQSGASNCYYVCVTGINAANLNAMYEIDVTDGSSTGSIAYGVMTYVYCVLSSPSDYSDSLVTLCRSLYYYSMAAEAYFEG